MILNVCIVLLPCLLTIYAGLALYAYFFAEKLTFPAPAPSYKDDTEILKLEIAGGQKISAIHLKANPGTALLLYSHGNGEDIGQVLQWLEPFKAAGISVLAYDYPGYGTSDGTPSEHGCYAAAESAYLYATSVLSYAPENIILYGRSLGSGPSCWLAEKHPVSGLILEGAFSSIFRVVTYVKILPWDLFDNMARLPKIVCPTLVIHGTRDETVPFSHAKRNARIAGGNVESLWLKDAGHNNLIEHAGSLYWDRVLNFIRENTSNQITR